MINEDSYACRHTKHKDHEQIAAYATAPQRAKKSAPTAQPDTVDKEYQADLIKNFGQLEPFIQGPKGQTNKEDRRNAKGTATNFDLTKQIAERSDEEKEDQRLRAEKS